MSATKHGSVTTLWTPLRDTTPLQYVRIRLVAARLVPRPGPRHQGGTFNLECSGRGRPGTFQVWAAQKNLAGYVPGRTTRNSTFNSTGVPLRAPTERQPAGVCEIKAHRAPMNLWGLGSRMSPNHMNSYGLVTSMATNPINS